MARKEQHPPDKPVGRHCWVCGKAGGTGFTASLRLAGYEIPKNVVAHAHGVCVGKALKQSTKETKNGG